MSAAPSSAAPKRRWLAPAAFVLLALIGAAAGAYLDWRWWHPMSGITVTIGAGLVLVLAALAWAVRRGPARPIAIGLAVLGVGLLLGQNLGPTREPVGNSEGTLSVTLSEPANATVEPGRATCGTTPSGANFLVSGDEGLRIRIGDEPLEERDFLVLSVTKGDMWAYGESRADGIGIVAIVGRGGPLPEDGTPDEVTLVSSPDSQISGTATQEAGSLTFEGLVVDPERNDPGAQAVALAGTIEWSCEVAAARP